jgi:ornithine cyclodeaminase/alanine dehydrogenase-like protein (mu-crystallin family)
MKLRPASRSGRCLPTRVLAAADMVELLERVGRDRLMDLMIERLRVRFVAHDPVAVQSRDRDGFRYDKPALGLLEWMPTHEIGGPVVVKMVGYHPTNPLQRGLPSVIATSSMWDTESGHLVAIADATLLTAVRTGAASALATDVLACDGPVTLGVVGLGAQAVTQVHAVSRVRPIDRVIGIDVDDDVAASFADRIAFVGADVDIRPPAARASILADVDVLCTCTSVDIGAGPVVSDGTHRPWLHVNAVGADFPGKRELPASLVRRAVVVPDVLSQCLAEGECQHLAAHEVGPGLAAVMASGHDARAHRDELTVFDSTGWAVEDDVALRLAIELAGEHGVGHEVQLERLPADPYDPYRHEESE